MSRHTRPGLPDDAGSSRWYLADDEYTDPRPEPIASRPSTCNGNDAGDDKSCASTRGPGGRNKRRGVRPRRRPVDDGMMVIERIERHAPVVDQRTHQQATAESSSVGSMVAFAAILLIPALCWWWYLRNDGADATRLDESVTGKEQTEESPHAAEISGGTAVTPSPSKKNTSTGQECESPNCTEGKLNELGSSPDMKPVPPPMMPDLSSDNGSEEPNLAEKEEHVNSTTHNDGDAKDQAPPLSSEFHVVDYSEVTSTPTTEVRQQSSSRRGGSVEQSMDVCSTAFATPPRSARSNAVGLAGGHSSAATIQGITGTPRTPQEFVHTVKALASFVSSTGLDEQTSLLFANETVVKKIHFEVEQRILQEKEASRVKLEERRREEDKRDKDRRHGEKVKAMRNEPGLKETLEKAREKCKGLAFNIFPFGHLWACIGIALAAMFIRQNFATVQKLVLSGGEVSAIVSEICGCGDATNESEGSPPAQTTYSYFAEFMPKTFSSSWTSSSSLMSSATCIFSFLFKRALFVALLVFLHKVLQMFHCPKSLHQVTNLFAASSMVMTSLVRESPRHESGYELLLDLVPRVAVSNFILMNILLIMMSWLKSQSDAAQRTKESDSASEKRCEREVYVMDVMETLCYNLSWLAAVLVGVFWV